MTTTIRLATLRDIPMLIEFGRRLHGGSCYSVMDFDPVKLASLLEVAIKDPMSLVLVCDRGYFVGHVTESFFGKDLTAYDVSFYMEGGGLAARKMINWFKSWATEKGAKMITLGISTGLNERISRLYELCGFPRAGFQHVRWV